MEKETCWQFHRDGFIGKSVKGPSDSSSSVEWAKVCLFYRVRGDPDLTNS